MNTLNRLWRLLATGFSFLVFGVFGIMLSVFITLFIHLPPLPLQKKRSLARKSVSLTFRGFIALMSLLGLLSYEIHHRQRLRHRGQLVLANHPTLIDVVFLISLIDRADCIVKAGLKHSWLTRFPIRAAAYLTNDMPDLISVCLRRLQYGDSLVIFPEGTRSIPGKPLSLLRGASNIALMSEKPITPVVIRCEPVTLLKNQPWYRIPEQPPHYILTVMPDIVPSEVVDTKAMQSKQARQLTRFLAQYFTEHAQHRVAN